ncbi:MAG: ribosomal protein L7/L12 [Clostridia bacterium]|nr:ribosomal protein L7/L12 [Clostridia bacterium]
MRYDVELSACGNESMKVVKELKNILGTDWVQAKRIVENLPTVVMKNVDIDEAERVEYILESCGATVKLISLNSSHTPMPVAANGVFKTSGNDRERLIQIYNAYTENSKKIKELTAQIEKEKLSIKALDALITSIKNNIEKNKSIIRTNGENSRPKARFSLSIMSAVPDFDDLKFILFGGTIVTFVLFLFLVAIVPKFLENLIPDKYIGLTVWLGSPAVGVALCLVVIVFCAVREIVEEAMRYSSRLKDRRAYDANHARNEAEEFLSHINEHYAEITRKEEQIKDKQANISQLEVQKKKLRAFSHDINMPPELCSADGVAILLNYIDTGRASSIQDAINLHDSKLLENARLEEYKKQTEYARVQAENARIAAENSEKALEISKQTAADAERAADAAADAAYYERQRYWDNLMNANKK